MDGEIGPSEGILFFETSRGKRDLPLLRTGSYVKKPLLVQRGHLLSTRSLWRKSGDMQFWVLNGREEEVLGHKKHDSMKIEMRGRL